MKDEANNEIDLLLRRLGGRRDMATPVDGVHLDADELSAYAENALPAAARTRYTDHLAECAGCRKLVTQLTASAGLVTSQTTAPVAEPSALRKFIASIFSPIVLRYAAPALGLIIIAAIGLVVLREDGRDSQVAKLNENQPAAAPEPSRVDSFVSEETATSRVAADSPAGQKKTESRESTTAPVDATSGAKTEAPPPLEDKQEVAKAAAPPPAPAVATATDEIRVRSDVAKREVKESPTPTPSGEISGDFSVARDAPRRTEVAPGARSKSVDSRAMRAPAETFQAAEAKEKDDAETRAIAGRRFRRSGPIWIDTAYNSSQATVNITRGSEQYRALIADEPDIRSIAEQLDGEIIVVWKGRAYRIR